MNPNTAILGIFAATYLGIAVGRIPGLKINRVGIVLLGAIAMMLFGRVTTAQAVASVNGPTICLLFGFFVISAQLRLSGFYDRAAAIIADQLDAPGRFLLLLMLATGGLSAFLNHDVVCLVFAPIVCTALQRKQLNPVPFLIALAVASNLGAGATLIGNPQNMMIGEVAKLDFGRYLLWSGVPVLFAMITAYAIIWQLSRTRLAALPVAEPMVPFQTFEFNRWHTVKGFVLLGIVVLGLFSNLPKEVVALAAAGVHLASTKFRTEDLLGLVDWPILVFFIGLFVVAGAFETTGMGEAAVHRLALCGFNLDTNVNLTLATTILANLIGNSAAVMLLLKVADLHHSAAPYILALSNSFGGSLIVIGSVSNIIVVQQAREMGVRITFWDFARLGIPVTLVALAGLLGWVALTN